MAIGVVYEVQDGDNLSSIAEDFNIDLNQIYELNSGLDEDNTTIYPGNQIVLENLPDPNLVGEEMPRDH